MYGLGANALDAMAVAKIVEIKRRPRFDPPIVHVHSMAQARHLVKVFPETAVELARRFRRGRGSSCPGRPLSRLTASRCRTSTPAVHPA
ncbi:MAG: L-threonylcarbamoyladenylate synthase [Planctomycetota bacterium]